jgi:hypothetical protein
MSADMLVLVPGLMGSELFDRSGKLVWGIKPSLLFRQLSLSTILDRLHVSDDDGIRPGAALRLPSWLPIFRGIEPYAMMLEELPKLALHPSAVVEFGYDWRKSIEHNAAELAKVVKTRFAAWRETARDYGAPKTGPGEPRVTFICHSMGGLVARWFATFLDKQGVTRRVLTLGTPFGGAVKAVRALASGDLLQFGLLSDSLRRAVRTMPGIHDLLPTYPCVDRAGDLARPSVEDITKVGATRALVEAAAERAQRIENAQGGGFEVRSLVGVQQRTLLSWNDATEPSFVTTLNGKDHGGDGTVFAGSAFIKGQKPGGYLPQSHGALAKTTEAVAFVRAVVSEDELRQMQAGVGPGLVVPEAASVGQSAEFEVTEWNGSATIILEDAESGREEQRLTAVARDGRRVAATSFQRPGLYRARLVAGGYSDVAELVAVTDSPTPSN